MKISFKNIAVIVSMFIAGTSCDNFLDVHPQGEVLGKELLTDRKGFENAMYGVYATMREPVLYGKNMTYSVLDVMAQYFNCQGNDAVTDLSAFNYYKNADVKRVFFDIWSNMYRNISYVNNVLVNLENQSPATLKFYDIYKGEALGLRAFMHFDLLRLFASQKMSPETEGIVYSTDFSLKPEDIEKKDVIVNHIISELREAEQLLDNPELYAHVDGNDDFLRDPVTHFNLQAVRATLARVYLTVENLDSAFYYSDKVIKESGRTLVAKTDIKDDMIGTLSSKETIFGLYSKDIYPYTKDDLYDRISFMSLDPRNDMQRIYDATNLGNDYRWSAWFEVRSQFLRCIKLTDKYQLSPVERPAGNIPGINLIRLPEMYYIAAECLLKKGDARADEYFDEVLNSRGLISLADRVPAQRLNLRMIIDERFKEFVGEGQTFFNMKRLNLDINRISNELVPASEDVYVIHIPEEEFNYRY